MRRIKSVAALSFAALVMACVQASAQSSVESRLTGLRLNGNEPIEIESDKLEVRETENKAIFTGNVAVTQGPTVLNAGVMTVFYAKDGGSAATGSSNIDRLEVDGKVYVKSDKQIATGDSGVFDMKSEVLTLSGKEVVLSEGNNVLRGCKLTVQMKTGRAQVDGCSKGGRVQMKLDPSSRQ
ncbi:MAG: LptA/OstA family protein [Mesorhizobium sp.]|nr:LptA/OstA family protein [Mesorhizobium sp.]MBL8576891.1 LptA/OstA family protein [Mesorhizobium sp.]